MNNITPVILCGGSGTRLWPLSRAGFPKQFLILDGNNSLFQQAVQRINCLAGSDICVEETIVVTNEEHRFLALDQLRELKSVSATLLLEPVGKNTAPALTLAALKAIESGRDPILVVSPADQTIANNDEFVKSLRKCVELAAAGSVVILGIKPVRPETGYGYVKCERCESSGEYAVSRFVEKPDVDVAEKYLEEGGYFWNSGIFVFKASVWLQALNIFRSDIAVATELSWFEREVDEQFIRPNAINFSKIPAESIDYAVMEKCPGSVIDIKLVPLDAGWNDLGVWDAVWQTGERDIRNNVLRGDILQVDTENSLIFASSRAVATVGVSDLIVVETADAVLVAKRDQSQHVKKIVALLEQQGRNEHSLHRKVHRPWGWYDSVDEGERFKVKRIKVKPGASLSLQKHHHRAEHWIVVKGTAEVVCGDETILLTENQSTYIPLGEVHRLINPGTIPLEIIEVQSGSYLGEDDIVRFDDTYGRTH
jgi:mannose-1-phosphate guanylyltransferase/mannose-6-phosphate isomerase